MFRVFGLFMFLGLWCVGVASGHAQDMRFFRIGTGSISGVYFPVGGLLASAISNPSGDKLCGRGGSCGVPGLVAVAQATRGSVANVRGIRAGRLESGLVQADIAFFAANGKGAFAGKKAAPGLRAIANLYAEAVQVVVRRGSSIRGIGDLRGKKVSLDLLGSGTRAIALRVLNGYGITPDDLRQVNSQIGPAMDRLRSRRIDAFFFVGGFPAPALTRLSGVAPVRLLPIRGERAQAIRESDPFLASVRIPADTYGQGKAVTTLAVGALWLVSDKIDGDTVYGITRALWHASTRTILDQGPVATRQIRLENALKGVAVPLHGGAARFYREKGLLKN